MTDARIAELESRMKEQEEWNRFLRYENECIKEELRKLATAHKELDDDHLANGRRLYHLKKETHRHYE